MQKIGCGIIFSVLFGTYWCGITFLADGVFIWLAVCQLRTESYSVTEGMVTHSDLKVESDSKEISYRPEVRFRFQVAGQEYEGKRIRYDYLTLRKDRAYEVLSNYPVQKTVTVYYNPDAPADAVLEKELDIAGFYGLLFLTPFNAISFGFVGGVYAWLRGKQLGRPVIGLWVRDDGLNRVIRIYRMSPAFVALVAWGGTGFLTIFGVMLLNFFISLESAVVLGWLVTLAAPLVGWWQASKYYSQLRRDTMRGTIEIREADGRVSLLQDKDLRPARYSCRQTTDSDGDKSERFSVELPFHDPATSEVRKLTLPEQMTEDHAKLFVHWLNGELRLGATLP